MLECRQKHISKVIGGKLYCLGGIADDKIFLDSVECFDFSRNEWEKIVSLGEKYFSLVSMFACANGLTQVVNLFFFCLFQQPIYLFESTFCK